MSKIKLSNVALLVFAIYLCSCKKNSDDPVGYTDATGYSHGVFIINEGTFMSNNGSVSYFDPLTFTVTNNLYSIQNNGIPLGDVAQSLGVANDKAFIIVNNSKKIEVVDLKSFKRISTIPNLSYPRYFLKVNESTGYLTNGNMKGYVYVIDLSALKIKDSISVGYGPENLIKVGDFVYVANSGGWSNDSTVSVIDTKNNKLASTIKLDTHNPTDLSIDNNNNLWVLCKGKVVYFPNVHSISDSKLIKINTNTKTVDNSIIIGSKQDDFTPQRLSVSNDGKTLYYIEKDGLYSISAEGPAHSSSPFVSGNFYGLEVNPKTGDIYLLVAGNFTSAGYLSVFTSDGTPLILKKQVGIVPTNVVFN